MTAARTSQIVGETLFEAESNLRSSQIVGETLFDVESNLRSSQVAGEVLFNQISELRTSSSVLEVIYLKEYNFFVPDEDLSTGNWSPTAIYSGIDSDDSNVVTSDLTPSNDTFEVGLEDINNFDASQDLIIVARIAKVDSGGTPQNDGDTIDATIDLREDGTTTVFTSTLNDVQGDEGLLNLIVESSGKDAITNPNGLSLRVNANASVAVGGNERALEVAFLNIKASSEPAPAAPAEPAASGAIVGIDGTGVDYGGIVYVNYQNVGGEEDVGWAKYPDFGISGDINAIDNLLNNRLRSHRYYGGDNG